MPRDKKAHITKLKGLLKDADELYLATDEDREGEAIAWHLLDELKPKNIPVQRMVFHEITSKAILDCGRQPARPTRTSSRPRRPAASSTASTATRSARSSWKKVMSGLSAGRVQSVATRLVVAKERERIEFRVASYWDLEGTFDAGAGQSADVPGAAPLDRRAVASPAARTSGPTADQDQEGRAPSTSTGAGPRRLVTALHDTTYDVRSVEAKPYRRSPYAPFRTTTLQQEASRKLGMSPSVAMSVAQRLYENGYITYMRTDSTTLSGGALDAARTPGARADGAEQLPDTPRTYATKVKNAQEAHEAIRPSGELPHPGADRPTGDQFRLYELIWMRTVASQMKDAVGPVGLRADRRRGAPTAGTSSSARPAG